MKKCPFKRPVTIFGQQVLGAWVVIDGTGKRIADCMIQDEADFIVRAINAYGRRPKPRKVFAVKAIRARG